MTSVYGFVLYIAFIWAIGLLRQTLLKALCALRTLVMTSSALHRHLISWMFHGTIKTSKSQWMLPVIVSGCHRNCAVMMSVPANHQNEHFSVALMSTCTLSWKLLCFDWYLRIETIFGSDVRSVHISWIMGRISVMHVHLDFIVHIDLYYSATNLIYRPLLYTWT